MAAMMSLGAAWQGRTITSAARFARNHFPPR